MLKKLVVYILLSLFIISCTVCPKTEPGRNNNPDISGAPLFRPAIDNIVHSVGVPHRSNTPKVFNSETGEVVVPCIKSGREDTHNKYYGKDKDRPVCKVSVLNKEENREYLQILHLIEKFNKNQKPIRISRNAKEEIIGKAAFVSLVNYDGSCGSLTDTGGDQHESEVDCFSPQAQQCAGWVANGWTWVKNYPPCYEFYH